jgi:hypothetical protein
MVRKKVSSEAADPTLSPGWSFFGEVTKYYDHLAKYGDQVEVVSLCVCAYVSMRLIMVRFSARPV